MEYELRVIPGCPNTTAALELYRRALAAERIQADVRVLELTSDEQAQTLNFHGSPSFFAGGRDVFPATTSPALTCRVYPSTAGLSGLPSETALRKAIIPRRAAKP